MRDHVTSTNVVILFLFALTTVGVTSSEDGDGKGDVISQPSVPSTVSAKSTSQPSSTMTSSTESFNQTLQQVRRNIIRGSNSAVTITQRKYLKKELCTSAPLQQVVRHRGCNRRHVVNRFCYGQCNSFFIPKTVPRDYNDEASLDQMAFKSCSFCRPKTTRWVRVLLQCPRSKTAPTVRKKVEIVVQCSCTALTIS